MVFGYETCHDEHTCYFSYLTIKRLLAMNLFDLVDFSFVIRKRSRFGSMFSRVSYYTMIVLVKVFPQFSQGLFVVAKPK